MKSDQEHFPPHTEVSGEGFPGQSIDRRRFLQYVASVGAVAGLVGSESPLMAAQNDGARSGRRAGSTDSRLPDGTDYAAWEQPLTFSKTYYVDNQSAQADDGGPGSQERPFRTINKAAQVLQPGERVVIASGTYRRMRPPGARRHGAGADDQLRGRTGSESLHQGLGNPQGWLAEGIHSSRISRFPGPTSAAR